MKNEVVSINNMTDVDETALQNILLGVWLGYKQYKKGFNLETALRMAAEYYKDKSLSK